MKTTVLTLTIITLAIGAVFTVNAAPVMLEEFDNFKTTYLNEQTFSKVGATFSLLIAGIAIALGIKLKSMSK
ncbi:MAG: hypothetical protein U9R28_09040 [Pseudomonadota bacterium]|nr:hypothetical protein [Pseudomonadota bacterium]